MIFFLCIFNVLLFYAALAKPFLPNFAEITTLSLFDAICKEVGINRENFQSQL